MNFQKLIKGLKATLYSVCAYENNKIVAKGRVIGDGIMVFCIQDVIVLPQYQRQGIGSIIMDIIMKYIKTNSINNTIIGLMIRTNDMMGCGMTQFIKRLKK